MRLVNCRQCWQPNLLLSKRCVHCGDIDGGRFGKGLVELLVYLTGGATAIAVVVWAATFLFKN